MCCTDGTHCCPKYYKCDERKTSCVRGEVVIPWYTKLPAITNIQAHPGSEQCDSLNMCPERTTCCQLSTGNWGCCPLQNVSTRCVRRRGGYNDMKGLLLLCMWSLTFCTLSVGCVLSGPGALLPTGLHLQHRLEVLPEASDDAAGVSPTDTSVSAWAATNGLQRQVWYPDQLQRWRDMLQDVCYWMGLLPTS